jgi:hypothetical protein
MLRVDDDRSPRKEQPAMSDGLARKNEVSYVRQQKGHSIILHLLLGVFILWINVIVITVSKNHYWHA